MNKSVPNIYLIGMMGSGKSVTGKKLAELMDMQFVDLDERLESWESLSISQLFKTKGEAYFREKETEVLNRIASTKSQVIATGGGIVLKELNVALMRDTGLIVYLETSLNQIWERVKGKKGRPLLEGENPKAKLEEIYLFRKPKYEEACDFSVETDSKTAEQVAKNIMNRINQPS